MRYNVEEKEELEKLIKIHKKLNEKDRKNLIRLGEGLLNLQGIFYEEKSKLPEMNNMESKTE